jgi:hypothetical protein
MSNPINPTAVSFDDMPQGLGFDDLFPAETAEPNVPAGTSQEPVPQSQAAPQTPSFEPIKAGDSVYNSKEDLIKGIEHKDALIRQLRQQTSAPQPEPTQTQQVSQALEGYMRNPERYLQDLVKGAESDPRMYVQAQAGLIDERLNEVLAPFASMITEIGKERAAQAVASEIPDFQQVRGSQEFKQVLEELPDLKQAIEMGEQVPQMQDKLPGLYKVAYFAARGRQLPDLLKQQQQAVAQTAPQQVRPTLTSSTVGPPTTQGAAHNVLTPEGRRAWLAEMESRGILDRKF